MIADVELRVSGHAGRITLRRPGALNALSPEMSVRIENALLEWADDPRVALVVIDAEGEKAFCAGGDIADIHAQGRAGNLDFARDFWRQEYRMNLLIARYSKPVISLMQGFTMGGGVGLGCHAAHRVVCESSKIAMPECAIGLVPDVGGSWLLARAPGHCGEYLGLTGGRMGPADAIHAGFADHFVPSERWEALTAALEETGTLEPLKANVLAPGPSTLAVDQGRIDALFARADINGIMSALRAAPAEDGFEARALEAIGRASPLSIAAALELVRRSREAGGLAEALTLEFRATTRLLEDGDFLEGIRAMIVDKDRTPNWSHARPEDVDSARIEALLSPLPEGELQLAA